MESTDDIEIDGVYIDIPNHISFLIDSDKFDELIKLVTTEMDKHDQCGQSTSLCGKHDQCGQSTPLCGHLIVLRYCCQQHKFNFFKAMVDSLGDKSILFADDNILLKTAINYYYNNMENLKIIKYLVENGADVTVADNICIQRAVNYNSTFIVKLLLKYGADIHAGNDYAIRYVSQYGTIEMVQLLLENGASLHVNDEALRMACIGGQLEMVKYLVENGANVHARNNFALKLCIKKGLYKICKYLLENGCCIDCLDQDDLKDAILTESYQLVELLINYGADFTFINNDAITMNNISRRKTIDLLVSNGVDRQNLYLFYLNKNC